VIRREFIRRARLPFFATVLVFVSQAGSRAQGQEIRGAAAADLKFAMDDLTVQYRKQTGG
jgi:ABC-type molybdate transport system substrate-binding protein